MAIFRSVGAKPIHIGSLYLFESMILTVLGILLGMMMVYVGLIFLHPILLDRFGIYIPVSPPSSTEWIYAGVLFLCGVALGLVPFIKSYRMTLKDGLEIKT